LYTSILVPTASTAGDAAVPTVAIVFAETVGNALSHAAATTAVDDGVSSGGASVSGDAEIHSSPVGTAAIPGTATRTPGNAADPSAHAATVGDASVPTSDLDLEQVPEAAPNSPSQPSSGSSRSYAVDTSEASDAEEEESEEEASEEEEENYEGVVSEEEEETEEDPQDTIKTLKGRVESLNNMVRRYPHLMQQLGLSQGL